jgi:acyl carrier protein
MNQYQHFIDKINGVLSEEFEMDIGRIVPGANFRQVLSLDSLDYVDLAALIDNHFSFKVKPEDFATIISFHDLYEYITSQVQANERDDEIKVI